MNFKIIEKRITWNCRWKGQLNYNLLTEFVLNVKFIILKPLYDSTKPSLLEMFRTNELS